MSDYPQELEALVVEMRQVRGKGGKAVHTFRDITAVASARFGVQITQGKVEYAWKRWLRAQARDETWREAGQDTSTRQGPEDGTKLQCRCCGQAYWMPDVPQNCLRCPTRLSFGGQGGERLMLTADCVVFDPEREW